MHAAPVLVANPAEAATEASPRSVPLPRPASIANFAKGTPSSSKTSVVKSVPLPTHSFVVSSLESKGIFNMRPTLETLRPLVELIDTVRLHYEAKGQTLLMTTHRIVRAEPGGRYPFQWSITVVDPPLVVVDQLCKVGKSTDPRRLAVVLEQRLKIKDSSSLGDDIRTCTVIDVGNNTEAIYNAFEAIDRVRASAARLGYMLQFMQSTVKVRVAHDDGGTREVELHRFMLFTKPSSSPASPLSMPLWSTMPKYVSPPAPHTSAPPQEVDPELLPAEASASSPPVASTSTSTPSTSRRSPSSTPYVNHPLKQLIIKNLTANGIFRLRPNLQTLRTYTSAMDEVDHHFKSLGKALVMSTQSLEGQVDGGRSAFSWTIIVIDMPLPLRVWALPYKVGKVTRPRALSSLLEERVKDMVPSSPLSMHECVALDVGDNTEAIYNTFEAIDRLQSTMRAAGRALYFSQEVVHSSAQQVFGGTSDIRLHRFLLFTKQWDTRKVWPQPAAVAAVAEGTMQPAVV